MERFHVPTEKQNFMDALSEQFKGGFKTKKEALNYEKEFMRKTAADMKMEMNSFIQVYFENKRMN